MNAGLVSRDLLGSLEIFYTFIRRAIYLIKGARRVSGCV